MELTHSRKSGLVSPILFQSRAEPKLHACDNHKNAERLIVHNILLDNCGFCGLQHDLGEFAWLTRNDQFPSSWRVVTLTVTESKNIKQDKKRSQT